MENLTFWPQHVDRGHPLRKSMGSILFFFWRKHFKKYCLKFLNYSNLHLVCRKAKRKLANFFSQYFAAYIIYRVTTGRKIIILPKNSPHSHKTLRHEKNTKSCPIMDWELQSTTKKPMRKGWWHHRFRRTQCTCHRSLVTDPLNNVNLSKCHACPMS